MGAEAAEMNKQPVAERVAPIANGKTSDDVEKKMPTGSDAASNPLGRGGGGKLSNGGTSVDDETASTLAAASEKLQAAHRREQKKRRKGIGGCFLAPSPKKILGKLRDYYVNTCIMASEKGDLAEMAAGHTGLYYGDTVMSRQVSLRRDRDHEEILQASLTRQVSLSLSRQSSHQKQSGQLKMTRNTSIGIPGLSRQGSTALPGLNSQTSTGNPGLNRQYSTGIAGLNRQTSTGIAGVNRQTSTGMAGLNRQTSTGMAGLNRQTSTGISGPTGIPSTGIRGLDRLSSTGRTSMFDRHSSSKKQPPNLFSGNREQFLHQQATTFTSPKPGQLNLYQNRKVSSVPESEVK